MLMAFRHNIFILLFTALALVGCVADKGASKSANCGAGQEFDAVTRKCKASLGATAPSNLPPVATTTTATISEDTAGTSVALNYTDVDGDLATSCTIVGYDVITFGAPPTCSCSGGFCFATLIPNADHARLTSFSYTVTEPNDGASAVKTVVVSMVNLNDLPVFGTTVVAGVTNEDTTLALATLPAVTDVDCNPAINDLPNANCPSAFTYQITSFTATPGVGSPASTASYTSVIKNCMGLNGSAVNDLDCDITPEANYYGTYDFVYRGNDGWGNSTNTVAVTITVNSINDGPTALCTSVPCTIAVSEDGNAVEPQDPAAAAVNYDFLVKNDINYTYQDVEDTSSIAVTDSDAYATCTIDATGIVLGTITVLDNTTCQLRWTPGALNTNGAAGSFTVAFTDQGGATTTPFTVNLTVTPKNDDPTAVNTFAYNTFDLNPFQESATAFAAGANDYPYSFTISPSTTVDPAPGTPTEVLTYTLDTVSWNLNGTPGGPVLPTDPSVPFTITGCMGGTSLLTCSISLNGDDGNIDGTITGNFTASDGSGGSDSSSFTVTIQPVVDAPIACQYSRFIDSPECGLSGCTGASSPLSVLAPTSHTALKPVFWYDSSKATCWKSTGTANTNWTPNGKNEVQQLNFTAVPTSGTFTLDFDGQITAAINYNDTAATVEAALEALSNLTNVSVSGTIGSSLTVTFTGNVALSNVAQLVVNSNSLSNGSAVSISISTTTPGGNSIINNQAINEKDILYIRRLFIDEGGTAAIEDALNVDITNVASSNSILIQPTNIFFSRDGTTEAAAAPTYAWNTGVSSSDANAGYIKIIPTGTTAGSSTISFDITNGTQTTSVSFVVTVNPVSIQHNDWKVIRAAGPTINKYGEVKSVSNVCSFSRDQCKGLACTGVSAPTLTTNGGALGALYLATGTNTCYHHNGTDWFPLVANVCPVTATAFESNCSGNGASCIGNAKPTQASGLGHYFYDDDDDVCYVSVETDGDGTGGPDFIAFNAPGSATITWENFTLSGTGSISGYWIYRRVAGETYDYDFPINKTIIPLGTTTYTDNATNSWEPPAPNFTYYYEVRPVINSIPTKPVENYAQARLIVPNDNNVFMSRRVANKLMCSKLLSPSDKTNNNRCPYVGPGDVAPGYYDIGNDLIVNRFETGCPYTIGACDTTDGNCVSNLDPSGNITAAAGTIFYSRSTGICYEGGGGTVWAPWDITTATAAETLASAQSELPPLVFVAQAPSASFCAIAGAHPTIVGLTGAPVRALPTRKQQMAYTQWDTQSLNDSSISSLETGLSLNSSAKCNASSASGLTGYADTETPDSSSAYSLPGTNSSGIRSVATGSTVTAGCQSFAGVQDGIGNVAEWVQDQFSVTSPELVATSADYSTAVAGSVLSGVNRYSVDIGNPGGAPVSWGTGGSVSPVGPCNDTDADDDCDGTLESWVLENKFNDAGRYFIPMGIPVNRDFDDNTGDAINTPVYPTGHPQAGNPVGTITSWAKVIGQTSGITSSQLHGDSIDFNMTNIGTATAGMVIGGGYTDGSGAGLYRFELQDSTQTAVDIGFRCVAPVSGTYGL